MSKIRLGDIVYPIATYYYQELFLSNNNDIPSLFGIVVEKSTGTNQFSILWLDTRTRQKIKGLHCAWWEEEDLTMEKSVFVNQVQEWIKNKVWEEEDYE